MTETTASGLDRVSIDGRALRRGWLEIIMSPTHDDETHEDSKEIINLYCINIAGHRHPSVLVKQFETGIPSSETTQGWRKETLKRLMNFIVDTAGISAFSSELDDEEIARIEPYIKTLTLNA